MTDLERPPDSDPTRRGAAPSSAASISFSAHELAAACGGVVERASDRPIRGGAVDSCLVAPGMLFAALPGERTDGHRHLADAVAGGAAAVLVAREPDPAAGESSWASLGDVTIVRVPDVLKGLHRIAAAWRTRFTPLVIGITGSVAKTSTKEAVATVLDEGFLTLRTEGNRNNEVGLPLTVLGLGSEHEAAVLEMGMYVGGEIRDLAAIARPSVGVVTAVQGVHLSRIGSLDAIEAAKGELVEALPSAADGGVAVLNADDPRVRRMAARTAARVVTYGLDPGSDVGAEDVVSAGLDGMRFTLRAAGRRHAAAIPALGVLSVHNALAAAAVGLVAGMSIEAVVRGLRRGWTAPHRGAIVRAGEITLIDDAYNASPASMRAALDMLAGLEGRRVAVLGEMRELGAEHDAGHRAVGAVAAQVAQLLVVVDGEAGGAAAGIADGARASGLSPERIVAVPDVDAAVAELRGRLRPGDVVLVKASRGVELERVVDALAAEARAR